MEFDLTSFSLYPTTEEFNKCRKADLLQIADFLTSLFLGRDQNKLLKRS